MNRYIKADALIERWNKMSVRGRTEFDQEIMVAPSIDIEPKRGKWLSSEYLCTTGQTICKACGTEYYIDDLLNVGEGAQEYLPNFCPHCGADMREREGE